MKLIRFVHNNVIIKTDERDLTINQIEATKSVLAHLRGCKSEEIDIFFQELDLSDYDVTDMGIHHWKDIFPNMISGIGLSIVEGSDEYLDALLENNLEEYLIFK